MGYLSLDNVLNALRMKTLLRDCDVHCTLVIQHKQLKMAHV